MTKISIFKQVTNSTDAEETLRVKLREIEGGLRLRQASVENQSSTELFSTRSRIQKVQVNI